MVNFSRSHKTTYAATNRTSVASNLTTQSNRTGTHSSFIAAAAKRVVSAFEPRVSWATTSTAHTMEDKEHQGLLVPPPPPTSESASTHSAEESKRHRKRGPKITAMLTMFEQKHSSEADKENVGEKDQFASKVSVLATSPTVTKSCETARIPHAIEDKIPYSIMEKTNSKTMSDLIAPLPTKSSKVRKLRSMASKMELTIKREKSVRDATYSAQEQRYQIDKSIAKSWDDKVDALAAWSTVSLTNGFMDRPDLKTLMTANDVPSEGCMPTSNRAAKLLTPEQDLIECFSPDRCLPHLAAYFAKILNEVAPVSNCEVKDKLTNPRQRASKAKRMSCERDLQKKFIWLLCTMSVEFLWFSGLNLYMAWLSMSGQTIKRSSSTWLGTGVTSYDTLA